MYVKIKEHILQKRYKLFFQNQYCHVFSDIQIEYTISDQSPLVKLHESKQKSILSTLFSLYDLEKGVAISVISHKKCFLTFMYLFNIYGSFQWKRKGREKGRGLQNIYMYLTVQLTSLRCTIEKNRKNVQLLMFIFYIKSRENSNFKIKIFSDHTISSKDQEKKCPTKMCFIQYD